MLYIQPTTKITKKNSVKYEQHQRTATNEQQRTNSNERTATNEQQRTNSNERTARMLFAMLPPDVQCIIAQFLGRRLHSAAVTNTTVACRDFNIAVRLFACRACRGLLFQQRETKRGRRKNICRLCGLVSETDDTRQRRHQALQNLHNRVPRSTLSRTGLNNEEIYAIMRSLSRPYKQLRRARPLDWQLVQDDAAAADV